MSHREAAVLGLRLAELQNLVDEVQQALRTGMDAVHLLGEHFRQAGVGHQVFQRTHNQRERRAQLVGDVGKEAQALLVQLLFLLRLPARLFQRGTQLQLVAVRAEDVVDDAAHDECIDELCPPGEPQWRIYHHLHLSHLGILPFLVLQLGAHLEGVFSRTQVAEGYLVVALSLIPFVIQSLHQIRVLHVAFLGKVAAGEGNLEGVLVVIQMGYAILVQCHDDALLLLRGTYYLFAVDDLNHRHVLLVGEQLRIERADAARRTEIDDARR